MAPLDHLHSAGDDEPGLFVRIKILEGVMRAPTPVTGSSAA